MSEAFLNADIALFSSFKEINGGNVIDFIELIVQSLNYRFTSSKINGKRNDEAVIMGISHNAKGQQSRCEKHSEFTSTPVVI
jgi:hypothetical protein